MNKDNKDIKGNSIMQAYRLLHIVFMVMIISTVIFGEPVTRVGVLTPFISGDDTLLQKESVDAIKKKFHQLGGYDVYTEKRMRSGVQAFDKKYPEFCHEPRCAANLGELLDIDRVIYGDVTKNGNRYAVELTLVDVATQKIVNTASIEGDDGVPLDKVIDGAINIIEEIPDSSLNNEINRYYGEEVDNRKTMAIASGTWIAFGTAFALIGNEQQPTKVEYSDQLSGIDPSMRATPKSARAKGMGNCYVAAAKDAYGAFYNPAGASWTKRAQAAVSYRSHFGMVNSMSAAFVGKATKEIGWGHTFSYSGSPNSYYQELDFGSIISYKVNNLFGKMRPFSIGAALNIASNRTTGGSGSEYDQKGTEFGFGLDVGMLFELTRKIDLGFVFDNIPFVMIHNNETQGTRSTESRPASFKLGATYKVSYATLLIAEGNFPLYQDQLFRFAGGLEQKIGSVFMLRFGAEKETLQSYDSPWHLTTGFGFKFPIKERNLYLDGAFDFNTNRDLLGIWDVSLKMDI